METTDFRTALATLATKFGVQSLQDFTPGVVVPGLAPRKKLLTKTKWSEFTKMCDLKKNSFTCIRTDLMHHSFLNHLRLRGMEMVIHRFYYQGCEMDVFALANDWVYEFELKVSIEDYCNDFRKIYHLGKLPVNKHSYLEAGKALPNFFYFVVPDGMLEVIDIPDHCGLIYGSVIQVANFPIFKIIKEAPQLHSDPVASGTYRTLASKLYRKYYDIMDKYGPKIFAIAESKARVHPLTPEECTPDANLLAPDANKFASQINYDGPKVNLLFTNDEPYPDRYLLGFDPHRPETSFDPYPETDQPDLPCL